MARPESDIRRPSWLDSTQHRVVDIILEHVKGPTRHAARNAVHHLGMAEQVAGLDREMAAFRGITAEEEAATAVFHALKRLKYPGSDRLQPRNHLHKNAVSPFLDSINNLFVKIQERIDFRVEFALPGPESTEKPRLQFWFSQMPIGDRLQPIPPFGFNISLNETRHDFGLEFEELAGTAGAESIAVYVKNRANWRNQLLYASAQGRPRVLNLNNSLELQTRRVFQILTALVFVDSYEEQQRFVVQCLEAFLKNMDVIAERRARSAKRTSHVPPNRGS